MTRDISHSPLIRYVLLLAGVVGILLAPTSCRKRVMPTYITVSDSVRHYYPIVAGEQLQLAYTVKNGGDEPFLIDDIQPSCGCIVKPIDVKAIPPHDSLTLGFTFDSSKNIGYVRHSIRLYGNVLPRGMATLVFDVNVVPPSSNLPDYEETHQQRTDGGLKEAVDGGNHEKGYYIPDQTTHGSRHSPRYPWAAESEE